MTTSSNITNLRQLSPEERQDFFNSFDTILCDCDGVLWMVLGSIPRVGEAIQLMKDKGKQVKFVSNNSMRSDKEYMEKFEKLGIRNVKENDIIHPAKTMAWYLNKYNRNATVYPLIPQPAIDLLISHGIHALPVDVDTNQLDASKLAKYILQNGPGKVDFVIVDVNAFTGFVHLVKALQYLKDPECKLIFGAMDAVLPLAPTLIIPGFLDFYDILIKHSQKKPVILGKPSELLADMLKERYSIVNSKRCLFIGDSLQLDICFGKSAGFQTLFVLTGADSKESMFSCPDECKPDYYTESVADFSDLFC